MVELQEKTIESLLNQVKINAKNIINAFMQVIRKKLHLSNW